MATDDGIDWRVSPFAPKGLASEGLPVEKVNRRTSTMGRTRT